MIELKLYDDSFELKQTDLELYKESLNADLMIKLISIDCKMQLYINKKLFFDDWICPLELFYQLKEWEINISRKKINNFEYNSIETSDNPVLSFNYNSNFDFWTIDGKFRIYEENKQFKTEELVNIFFSLESQLKNHIK